MLIKRTMYKHKELIEICKYRFATKKVKNKQTKDECAQTIVEIEDK